jgi:DNA-binding NarL/FixJ family response regulator
VTRPIRILLADDHPVVRRGLRALLEAEDDLQVVAEAANGFEAVDLGLTEDVDVAILDIAMPRMTGLQAARELSRRRPELRLLMLSMYDKEQYFFEALAVGASGYVLKRAADQDIVRACRTAIMGGPFIYPETLASIAESYLARVRSGDPVASSLTPREREIVKLIAEGHTSQQIADMLVISAKTVGRHRANVLEKLGLSHRGDLTRYAIREGLIEP